MGVVIEICVKYPGGPTRITVTDMHIPMAGNNAGFIFMQHTAANYNIILLLNIIRVVL
jgi:hypothetical protein